MQGAGVIYLFPFFLYDEVFCQLGKKFFFAQAVQVFHHAVVIYDMQLRGGKAYGKEIVIFLVSSVMGILAGFLCSDQSGGGGAVMSVGNIEIGNGSKQFGDAFYGVIIVDEPEMMTESVGSRKIVFGFPFDRFGNDGIEFCIVGICEEYRFDIGIIDADMFHTVFFLIAAGQLMFFDDAVEIVFYIGTNDEAILRTPVHRLSIDIIFFGVVLYEPAFFLEKVELLYRFVIGFGIVLISSRCEIDFGFDDVVKRFFISGSFCTGFFRVEHVIGTRSDLFDQFARGSYSSERFYFCHNSRFIKKRG